MLRRRGLPRIARKTTWHHGARLLPRGHPISLHPTGLGICYQGRQTRSRPSQRGGPLPVLVLIGEGRAEVAAAQVGRDDLARREQGSVAHASSVFGEDSFGRWAERAARFFGTPQYIVGQTAMVIAWIALNAVGVGLRWDPYPFILLNLAFSLQAAYAAPLILLAQTRQAERDKIALDQADAHREAITRTMEEREAAIKRETDELKALLGANTDLTRQDTELTQRIETLTREIHERLSVD